VYVHVYTSCPFTWVYSKELVPMIMDSGKLQGESKSWSPRRAYGVVSVCWSAGSRPRKTQCFKSGSREKQMS